MLTIGVARTFLNFSSLAIANPFEIEFVLAFIQEGQEIESVGGGAVRTRSHPDFERELCVNSGGTQKERVREFGADFSHRRT
jgi:hypothetical protein